MLSATLLSLCHYLSCVSTTVCINARYSTIIRNAIYFSTSVLLTLLLYFSNFCLLYYVIFLLKVTINLSWIILCSTWNELKTLADHVNIKIGQICCFGTVKSNPGYKSLDYVQTTPLFTISWYAIIYTYSTTWKYKL